MMAYTRWKARMFAWGCALASATAGSLAEAQTIGSGMLGSFTPTESRRESEAEEEEIETDRDSFTASTKITPFGRLITESSYSFIDNRKVFDTHSLPELLLRYGISERVEIRFGYNYEIGGAGNPISGNIPDDLEEEPILEEEARLLYGTKVLLSKQNGWMPESVFLVHGYTPTMGKETATTLGLSYVFGWKLRNRSVWDNGIRFGTGNFEGDSFNTWSPSTVLKIPLGERWKVHAEYFGVFTEGRRKEGVQHFFSPGAHYLITKDLEVGLRVGWGLNEESPNFFSNIGVGWQF